MNDFVKIRHFYLDDKKSDEQELLFCSITTQIFRLVNTECISLCMHMRMCS